MSSLTGQTDTLIFSCCGKPLCAGCHDSSLLMPVEEYAMLKTAKEYKIVAVDLDGTLARHYDSFDAAHIPKPRPGAKKHMERIKETGAKIIINTVRGDDAVTRAWLEEHDIPYDHVNYNPDQPEGSSDKIMADVYLDDRAVSAKQPLHKATNEVLQKLSLAELHDSIGGNRKSAATPYWQRGLKTQLQMPSWNPEQNPIDNLVGNVQQARQRAEAMVSDRDGVDDILSHYQPGFALKRFQRYIRSGDHVTDPLDKLLFRNDPELW